MTEKAHHRIEVVRVTEVHKHPNADTLGLIHIGGYQAVVKLDEYKINDLAVYIPPDSVVPEIPIFEFLWGGPCDFPVPERRRRITVRKFRGEWSEGLLMPLKVFESLKRQTLGPGDDVAETLGIYHYQPPEPGESRVPNQARSAYPRSAKGWFFWCLNRLLRLFGIDRYGITGGENMRGPAGYHPVYDVEAYKKFQNVFQPGETVFISEKIHGSNARFCFKNDKFYVGSRQLWKSITSGCVWRRCVQQNPWIEEWCREHEGYTLYGECVPTQKGFDYGCKPGEYKLFSFDVMTPEGKWAEVKDYGLYSVPIFELGCPWSKDLITKHLNGPSAVPGAAHIREGIVIRTVPERHVHGLGRAQLKIVSPLFYEKDSKQ